MEIYITYLLQILSFSSRFGRFEMKNFLCPQTMVAANISDSPPPPGYFFISTGMFKLYVYYSTSSFTASAHVFNPGIVDFNLPTCGFELKTCGFDLVTCGFELVTRGFELVTRRFDLVTRNS